jgi:amino acid transporter
MISVSAIIALRNLPSFAFFGSSILCLLGLATILFLIPISLVCAELASGWPKEGGLYAWVTEAFGETSGAVAVWLEWIESVVWLPTVLSFIGTTLAYTLAPQLGENKYYMLAVMMGVLWTGTIINFKSIKTSSWVSTFGIIAGSIIPGAIIILMGAMWVIKGGVINIELNIASLIPDINLPSAFAVIGLAFGGIEVGAFYIQDTKNPQKTYPRATFIAAIIVVSIYVLGSLTLALVIPKADLNLAAGAMQAMEQFFNYFNIPWATPLFAVLTVLGGLALLNTWIIGPSKGLLVSAEHGALPKFTTKTNKFHSPVAILLAQAIIGTFLLSMFLFIPTINDFYWFFGMLASQLIMMMYLFVFLSAIKLRFSQPNTPRLYKIPGGKLGMLITAGSGSCFCLLAIFFAFIPPEEYQFISPMKYSGALFAGICILTSPPLIWAWVKRKRA